MSAKKKPRLSLSIHPATPDRWSDFARLFGENGACAGCWCMWWRRSRSEWTKAKGTGNRTAIRRIIQRGEEPGLIAYDGERPVGWCAVAPREAYPGLARSRVLKPVDEQPVWAVTCFFIDREYRKRGVSTTLLRAAKDFVAARGGRIVEGYPVEATAEQPAAWVWTGLAAAYRAAGFREVARRSPTRPIFRCTVRAKRSPAAPRVPRPPRALPGANQRRVSR